MTRILVPVLALLLAGGAYWLFRSPDEPGGGELATNNAAAGQGSGTAANAKPTVEDLRVPSSPPPLRMQSSHAIEGSVAPVASAVSLAQGYRDEDRDPAVGDANASVVRDVVEGLAEAGTGSAHIAELDCRRQHCMLRLASGNEEGLVKLVDALQDERGFFGKAESIMLSREDDDMIFYLRFPTPK